ncbi:hypothetical protein BLNAU_3980 [Blattamonas nauphoetae]|uniref:Uncharacterized protein n=1 Tax=Blattamonas nauphoetae TaxID=2049346 RepID=A0ABQ9YB35_9EUKA|nr:hypothetical protein BLNAU_3980 [Blattamonas nauphoetae]
MTSIVDIWVRTSFIEHCQHTLQHLYFVSRLYEHTFHPYQSFTYLILIACPFKESVDEWTILLIENTLEVMIEPDKMKGSEDPTTELDGDDADLAGGNGGAHARLGFMKMISLEFSWKENAMFSV